MTATVTAGLGSLFQMTISTVLTTIGQRVTITGPSMKYGEDITTNLDSVSVERRATLLDAGTIKLQGEWLGSDSTHQFMMTTLTTNPQPLNASKLILAVPTHGTWAFNCFISEFELGGMTADGHVTFDLTVSISGTPVFT